MAVYNFELEKAVNPSKGFQTANTFYLAPEVTWMDFKTVDSVKPQLCQMKTLNKSD